LRRRRTFPASREALLKKDSGKRYREKKPTEKKKKIFRKLAARRRETRQLPKKGEGLKTLLHWKSAEKRLRTQTFETRHRDSTKEKSTRKEKPYTTEKERGFYAGKRRKTLSASSPPGLDSIIDFEKRSTTKH